MALSQKDKDFLENLPGEQAIRDIKDHAVSDTDALRHKMSTVMAGILSSVKGDNLKDLGDSMRKHAEAIQKMIGNREAILKAYAEKGFAPKDKADQDKLVEAFDKRAELVSKSLDARADAIDAHLDQDKDKFDALLDKLKDFDKKAPADK